MSSSASSSRSIDLSALIRSFYTGISSCWSSSSAGTLSIITLTFSKMVLFIILYCKWDMSSWLSTRLWLSISVHSSMLRASYITSVSCFCAALRHAYTDHSKRSFDNIILSNTVFYIPIFFLTMSNNFAWFCSMTSIRFECASCTRF